MIYETRLDPPLPRARFLLRLAGHGLVGLLLVAASLGIGIAGYEHFEGLAWRDAFLNSAMLLGGMGPVDSPQTDWFDLPVAGNFIFAVPMNVDGRIRDVLRQTEKHGGRVVKSDREHRPARLSCHRDGQRRQSHRAAFWQR
jgi:hypothetical protein